jgi:integrase
MAAHVPVLEEALHTGEGQRVEFKRGLSEDPARLRNAEEELLKSIAAFANTKIRQTYVHNIMQEGATTKLSKSSVEMHSLLAAVLQKWHGQTPYGKPQDYVFASTKLSGRKPRVGSMIVQDYLRPAAIGAEVITVSEDGQVRDKEGNLVRRFGFHTFRHSLASFLMAEGENPAVIQATLRHTRLDMTMYYSHARKQQTRDAQGMVLEAIMAKRGLERGLERVQ